MDDAHQKVFTPGTVFGSPYVTGSKLPSAAAVNRSLEHARAKYIEGHLEAAASLLEGATQTTEPAPGLASAWSLRARVALRRGETDLRASAAHEAATLFKPLIDPATPLASDELNDAAIAFYLDGDATNGEKLLQQAVDIAAVSPETFFVKGLVSFEARDFRTAADALGRAGEVAGEDLRRRRLEMRAAALGELGLEHAKEAADAFSELAQFHLDAQRYADALEAIDRALTIRPGGPSMLATKGEILRLVGLTDATRLDASAAALEESLRLAPDNPYTHAVYGETLRMLNRLDEAATHLKRAVDLDPSVGDWYYRLGEVLRLLNRPADGLAMLDEAIAHDRDTALTRSRRGEVLRVMSRFEEAIVEFDRALTLQPDDVWTLGSKGETLRSMQRFAESEEILQRAIQLAGGTYSFAEGSLGHLRLDQGRDAEALRTFEQVLRREPANTWALQGQGHAMLNLDQIENGLAVARRLAALDDSAWVHGLIGVLLYQTEQYKEGVAELERAVTVDPRLDWCHNALAACCMRLARSSNQAARDELLEKAVAAATAATGLAEDSSWQVTLGEALFQRGRRPDAVVAFKRGLDIGRQQEKPDYNSASDEGWASYRLALLDEANRTSLLSDAEQFYVEALALKSDPPGLSDAVSTRFNLALVMVCGSRFALGLREYENACTLAAKFERGLYRGVIGRARDRLADAIADWPSLRDATHAHRALKGLEALYDTIASEASRRPPVAEGIGGAARI